MDFGGPASLGLMLAVVGMALLAASLRVASVGRSYRRRMENILALAGQPIDPLDLPAAAWPDLCAGGWRRMRWGGSWFGQPVSGLLEDREHGGQPRTRPLRFALSSGDEVELRLELVHAARWGENRVFAEHLARVFALLLETRLHARTEALSAALAERARLSLYLQHDMRNLAQWVLWVSADFAGAETAAAMQAAARRLRDNAALAQERAERLIDALGKRYETEAAARVDLRLAAARAAQLAGIDLAIVGEASAWVSPHLLTRTLDNLFTNLAQAWRDGSPSMLEIRLAAGAATVELAFFSPLPDGSPRLGAQKLFEPFSSGRPGGLGLGLYQARKSLREGGGDLRARPADDGVYFILDLPAAHPL
ncbi:hypothetical protein B9N43_16845 [Denitratisoma sp. DHT3]|uniref:hypothetical protein n=1 Tax=Denitratisoma sp. DHT3 TaxID=1981880 RepID=UPI001198BEEB|nr:hypothetical protein [Denitratisoma sp. DHT3]QDX82753.1 hypothetical protein B9N43_16845 [Denitratisoma sp. DHT3]